MDSARRKAPADTVGSFVADARGPCLAANLRGSEITGLIASHARSLVLAEERERRRIARGLHDNLGHTLAVAKLKLGHLLQAASADGRRLRAGEILALLDEAIRETRSLSFELHSPVLDEFGLEPALASLCKRLTKEHAIPFHCRTPEDVRPLGCEQRTLLYRSVRELLRNVVAHAQARSAQVRVRYVEAEIWISVEDDGVGFDVAAVAKPPGASLHFGLFSVQQTLAAIGGRSEIDSAPTRGTRVALTAPVREWEGRS